MSKSIAISPFTYTKLKSGAWGARSTEEIKAGQAIEVVKKSGEKKTETVEKVVWSGNGVWLAALVASGRSAASGASRSSSSSRGRRRPGSTYECEECGDYVTPGSRCWETGMTH